VLSQQERLTFLSGGLAAPRDCGAPAWTQLGLAQPKTGQYGEISLAVREMLAVFCFLGGTGGSRPRCPFATWWRWTSLALFSPAAKANRGRWICTAWRR
jgi:hypothetical protein